MLLYRENSSSTSRPTLATKAPILKLSEPHNQRTNDLPRSSLLCPAQRHPCSAAVSSHHQYCPQVLQTPTMLLRPQQPPLLLPPPLPLPMAADNCLHTRINMGHCHQSMTKPSWQNENLSIMSCSPYISLFI